MTPLPHPLAVTATGLTKRYGDLLAVDDLDLEVPAGTVLRRSSARTAPARPPPSACSPRSRRPTAGTAVVCGHDVVTEADAVRDKLSLTGQFAALEDNLTAQENLELMARLRGYDQRRRLDDRPTRSSTASTSASSATSSSRTSRAASAVASTSPPSLVTQPELLVLDEPTTGLDPRSRQVVWSTIRDLVDEGVTLLLTTQYLDEADVLADRVVLIDHGRAVASGTPSDLKSQIGEQRVDIVAVDTAGARPARRGARRHVRRSACRASTGSSRSPPRTRSTTSPPSPPSSATPASPIDEIALRRPTLDDAFLALTGQPTDTDELEGAAA